MTSKSHQEIRISVGQDDLDKLQSGKILSLGQIDFGLPIRVSLQRRKL